jgi:hypothetical protein
MTDRLKQGTLEDKWKEYLVEATDINNNEECDKHPFTVVEPGSQTYTSEIDKKFSYTSDGWVEVEWDYNKHQWNITK